MGSVLEPVLPRERKQRPSGAKHRPATALRNRLDDAGRQFQALTNDVQKDRESTFADDQEGDSGMDWQEKYIEKLDAQVEDLKKAFDKAQDRIEDIVAESLNQTRHLDEARQRDTISLRAEITAIGDKLDRQADKVDEARQRDTISLRAEVTAIGDKLDRQADKVDIGNKWIHGMTITVVVTVGFAVLATVVTIVLSLSRL
jgi:DNA repair ATPase RecN